MAHMMRWSLYTEDCVQKINVHCVAHKMRWSSPLNSAGGAKLIRSAHRKNLYSGVCSDIVQHRVKHNVSIYRRLCTKDKCTLCTLVVLLGRGASSAEMFFSIDTEDGRGP